MAKATDERAKFSNEFTRLLKTIQTRRDYAAKMLEVENADELVRDVRTAPVTSGEPLTV